VQPIPSSVVSKKDKKKAKKKELQETQGEKSVPMVSTASNGCLVFSLFVLLAK